MIMRRASSCALLLILCWMAVVQGLARTSKRMQKRCILMSSRGSGSTPTTSSTSNKFRALKPIPGCGGYFIADADDTNARISSVFLAPTKMEVEQLDNEDDMILLNVLPVPVRSDVELALRAAGSINSAQQMVAKEIITSRDGGFFDNLAAIGMFQGAKLPGARDTAVTNFSPTKKMVFDYVQGRSYEKEKAKGPKSFHSPYHAMIEALDTIGHLQVTGLLLEVADRPSAGSILVGGAVLLIDKEGQKSPSLNDDMYDDDEDCPWQLSPKSALRIIRHTQGKTSAPPSSGDVGATGSQEVSSFFPSTKKGYFIKCFTDELVGFAHATKLPVVAASGVFDALCVNGLLQRASDSEELTLTAPYFRDQKELDAWKAATSTTPDTNPVKEETPAETKNQETKNQNNNNSNGNSNNGKNEGKEEGKDKDGWWAKQQGQVDPKKAIEDATTFLSLSIAEKREWIRRYGGIPSYRIPRPREGSKALDAAILPLLDVEVAYEILRRLAETHGNYEKAAAMADFESQKPSIAREINLARAKKDEKMATELCAQLDSLSRLSYNPFDPYAEVESGGWNLEKWYYDNRKKVYNILA